MARGRVVVGLSGGVDSSVAAYLLLQKGYEVIGIFMKNWHDTSVTISDECLWVEDSNDAMIVAEKLGIPFQVVDLSQQYKERVVDYMFCEYQRGRTPNPDILCNREIKFDVFLKVAQQLNANYIATGHYAITSYTKVGNQKIYRLLQGKDKNKDQSYFLCQLSQSQLSKVLFPIGELEKSKVREIAKEQGFVTANKKDSQGICFVGKVKLPDFLKQKLKPKEGEVIEIANDNLIYNQMAPTFENKKQELEFLSQKKIYTPDMGHKVGVHQGAHFYTIGQRKGLGIGGTKEPLFVIENDTENNILYVGQGNCHKGLFKKSLFINRSEVHWVRRGMELKERETLEVQARIRYRQSLQKAVLYRSKKGLYLDFQEEQWAITQGQFAVWYINGELIGSGVIS